MFPDGGAGLFRGMRGGEEGGTLEVGGACQAVMVMMERPRDHSRTH